MCLLLEFLTDYSECLLMLVSFELCLLEGPLLAGDILAEGVLPALLVLAQHVFHFWGAVRKELLFSSQQFSLGETKFSSASLLSLPAHVLTTFDSPLKFILDSLQLG